MTDERRGHDRESLAKAEIPGKFLIETDGASQTFNQVCDVSISGMGLVLNNAMNTGQEIKIKYVSEDFSVAINAVVAWCVPDQDDHRVGIQFSSEDLDANVMLFMTLREYIDDFGEAF